MLRTGVFRLIRTANIRSHRPISTSLWCSNSNNERKPMPTVDDLFKKDRRPIEPLVENPIIVKKFFVSEVDAEQMLYPEVISSDELDELIKLNQMIADYIEAGIEFDGKGISNAVHEEFKRIGLYGYNVPQQFGGRGFIHTQTIMATEAEAQNVNVAITLNAHRLVCEAINEFGSDEQRSKYLPKLAKGDVVATTALQEWTREEVVANRTKAEYDADKQQWHLNGTKSFVVNAAKANLFMVSAYVPQSQESDSLSIFLVDASLPGVSVHKKDITIGHTDLYQANVSFNDVHLTSGTLLFKKIKSLISLTKQSNMTVFSYAISHLDSILSTPGSGRHIERTTMFQSRLQQSVVNLVQMKAIVKHMFEMVDLVEQKKRILK